ncbi:hypothetical protein niasHT_009561 [Heterodera trifolii]|uniref:DNA-directed DNA polymerase n=1 Tax=Heterodera trifolii TaxID=157864 RepID=A0ABD2M8D7_9BILA
MENRPPKRAFPFSINDILGMPQPKKLRHGFMINQLLGLAQQEGEGAAETTSSKKLPSEYVEKMECNVEHVAKFHFTKVKSKFLVRDVPADPEGLLATIFQHCIDEATKDSREKGCEPSHLGCMISSPLLDGGDIPIPLRQITDNTINSILNQFIKVAQSKKQQNLTLWGEPFTIAITTVDRSGLPVKRHIKGGARRRLAPVNHQVHEKCLIKINNQIGDNSDNYCLFYALQATMVAKTRGWPSWKFFRYINDQFGQSGMFHQETVQLMRQISAPFDLEAYDADTYVPLVIDHWNNAQQRHRFAVFIFGTTGHYKPLYKYIDNIYDTPLVLYFNNTHFDGVHFISGLFGGKKYCLECEKPYKKPSEHNSSCKSHCLMCSRVGPAFPCPSEANFFQQCKACHKNFNNVGCYNHHLQSNYCARSKKCKDCGVHVLNEEVEWKCAEDNPYDLSLLKVWVIPPRQCDVPVLPVKVDDRLCFPLCYKCAKKYPTGGVDNDYHCQHSDEQRGWVSTCTSLELNAALDEGYRVTKVFRVLQYEQSDDKLFRSYISEFMALKIQASGFDSSIKGNVEMEQEFVRECYENFGITIDPAKMEPNKGKRSIAKLCLNNLWGRFSLRNFGLSQTLVTDDPAVLAEYLDNRSLEVTAIDELDAEHILISYETKKEWVEENSCSNIVISLWTTSAARLLLLKSMQKVVRTPSCQLLYTDTDSIILTHPDDNCPLKTGPHLGQFTDEYPKHEILEFCSGGAKQYGLKLRRKDAPADADNEYVLKVRGMTLNYDVIQNQGLRYDTFKEKVLRFAETGEPQPINVIYPNFLRPSIKDGRVTSCPLQKIYKPFVGKGIVGADLRILDFGHTL